MVAFALTFPAWRRGFLAAGLAAAVLTAAERVLEGEHFPSDVIFSAVLTCFVVAALYEPFGRIGSARAPEP